jgi:hypothetical protein
MQPNDQENSGDFIDNYEKTMAQSGLRRKLLLIGLASAILAAVIGGFISSMSYMSSLYARVYDVFEESDKDTKNQVGDSSKDIQSIDPNQATINK